MDVAVFEKNRQSNTEIKNKTDFIEACSTKVEGQTIKK